MLDYLSSLPGAMVLGLIWTIMALGVFITYKILNIADLTVDGSFVTGGIVAAVLITNGMNFGLALLIATLAGAICGLITALILLDIIMPKVSGIEALRRIKAHDAEMPVVMLSASSSQDIIQEAIQNGADGFLSKQADVHEIISAATSAAEGVHYYGKDIAQLIYDIKVSKSDVHIQLSKREQEVVELCSEGLTCHEIAERLFISPRTIETHKNAIFKKLGIHNSVELVRYAINHGIINL